MGLEIVIEDSSILLAHEHKLSNSATPLTSGLYAAPKTVSALCSSTSLHQKRSRSRKRV